MIEEQEEEIAEWEERIRKQKEVLNYLRQVGEGMKAVREERVGKMES